MKGPLILLFVLSSCLHPDVPVTKTVSLAEKQCKRMECGLTDTTLPKSFAAGEMITSDTHWWCSGFFPGVCWYTWRLGGDPEVREAALRQTDKLLDVDSLNREHDLGFQVLPSAYFAFLVTYDSFRLVKDALYRYKNLIK